MSSNYDSVQKCVEYPMQLTWEGRDEVVSMWVSDVANLRKLALARQGALCNHLPRVRAKFQLRAFRLPDADLTEVRIAM